MVLLGDSDDHWPRRHRAGHHSGTCLHLEISLKAVQGIFNLIYSFIGLGQLSLLLQSPGAASSYIDLL